MRESNQRDHRSMIIPRRQLSIVISLLVGLLFISFTAGYFVGRHEVIALLTTQAEEQSFGDQIYSSLYSSLTSDCLETDACQDQEVSTSSEPERTPEPDSKLVVAPEQSKADDAPPAVPARAYYAQLIGFGKQETAQKFARRLEQRGIEVQVKTRYSKTAKGRKIAWYQVVTPPHTDLTMLQQLVEKIKHDEKITGSRIEQC